ncbi:hypothetical protein QFZ78_001102 [Paenibacillus sp. V4I5]|nr:hypothetical protein [Paenibacillus sp. V4I5]
MPANKVQGMDEKIQELGEYGLLNQCYVKCI